MQKETEKARGRSRENEGIHIRQAGQAGQERRVKRKKEKHAGKNQGRRRQKEA